MRWDFQATRKGRLFYTRTVFCTRQSSKRGSWWSMRRGISILIVLAFAAAAGAHSGYIGYSGAQGGNTCAYPCHGGNNNGTVMISGFPEAYTPGQSYAITISHTSGSAICNFNASCRIGTGTTNAGTLSAGTGTATYNAGGETNGIHLSSNNQESATFNWLAPAAGTGSVRLYVAAHQGTSAGGANTAFVTTSTEAVTTPPTAASNPAPANDATGVLPSAELTWTAGHGVAAHTVFLGTSNPPDSVASVTAAFYSPLGLTPGATYYWKINERNAVGVTEGPLWTFSTLALPDTARNPEPANGAMNVSLVTAWRWSPVALADSYHVYSGLTNPPEMDLFTTDTLFAISGFLRSDTTYYWHVDAVNGAGRTQGPLWHFRTEIVNAVPDARPPLAKDAALGLVYPNPFNAMVTVPFSLPKSADVELALYDVTGRQVALIAHGSYAAGNHRIEWSSEGYATGVYLLRLTAGKKVLTTKVMAIK